MSGNRKIGVVEFIDGDVVRDESGKYWVVEFDCNGQPSLYRDGVNRKPEINETFTKHTITEYLTQEK